MAAFLHPWVQPEIPLQIFNIMPAVCEILVFQQSGGGCIRHRRPAGWLVVVRHDRIPTFDSRLQRCLAKNYSAITYLRVICANIAALSIKRLDRLKKIWIKGRDIGM